MRNSFLYVTVASLFALAPGCSSQTPGSPAVLTVSNGATSGPASFQPAHFKATFNHTTRMLTFQKVAPLLFNDGLTPKSVDSINDPAGAGGNPTAADVDLTSPNPCTFPTGQFSCEVEMIWGSPYRSLPNPTIQIDQETLDGGTTNLYNAAASDGNNPLGIAPDHGLWVVTNQAINPTGISEGNGPFYLTASGTGFNTGIRTLVFDNPGNADVIYDILVWASLDYSTYAFASASSSVQYINACASPGVVDTTNLVNNGNVDSVALPFDFTLWDQNYPGSGTTPATTVNFAIDGEITFGNVPVDFPGPSVDLLPSGNDSFATPGIWPFWDDLTFAAGGGNICYATSGSAPQRLFVIEWQGMDFNEAPDVGSDLDFEAILHEGTSQIDFVYHSMVPASGNTSNRNKGTEAFVGTQNATGTMAIGRDDVASFGTGVKVSLTPKH
jgi:hypothetical protein